MVALRLFTIDARTFGGDRHALARRIADAGADIACVHHAPSLLRWRSTCAAIGRESGLVTIAGGRTGGGTLLLSTLGVALEAAADLTFSGVRGARPPGAALASLSRLDHPFLLAGARLDRDRGRQGAQVAELQGAIEALDDDRPPTIICLNEAGSGAAVSLQRGRVALGHGVFVDARLVPQTAEITALNAGSDGVVDLVLAD